MLEETPPPFDSHRLEDSGGDGRPALKRDAASDVFNPSLIMAALVRIPGRQRRIHPSLHLVAETRQHRDAPNAPEGA